MLGDCADSRVARLSDNNDQAKGLLGKKKLDGKARESEYRSICDGDHGYKNCHDLITIRTLEVDHCSSSYCSENVFHLMSIGIRRAPCQYFIAHSHITDLLSTPIEFIMTIYRN